MTNKIKKTNEAEGNHMKTTVNRINVPSDRRIIVTSDVHGNYKHLKSLLEKVNFSEEDILFIIGDIIEKGPESLKTLRYVMDICKKYTVYTLIGNVDAWRLTTFLAVVFISIYTGTNFQTNVPNILTFGL